MRKKKKLLIYNIFVIYYWVVYKIVRVLNTLFVSQRKGEEKMKKKVCLIVCFVIFCFLITSCNACVAGAAGVGVLGSEAKKGVGRWTFDTNDTQSLREMKSKVGIELYDAEERKEMIHKLLHDQNLDEYLTDGLLPKLKEPTEQASLLKGLKLPNSTLLESSNLDDAGEIIVIPPINLDDAGEMIKHFPEEEITEKKYMKINHEEATAGLMIDFQENYVTLPDIENATENE